MPDAAPVTRAVLPASVNMPETLPILRRFGKRPILLENVRTRIPSCRGLWRCQVLGVAFRDKILTWDSLRTWRAQIRQAGERLVVTNGCFDLLHIGHATYLEAARTLGDRLLVGVNSDASVRVLKGPSRPIYHEDDRAGLIAALGCVDAVCLFDEPSAERFLEWSKPDIWAKGGDYTLETVHPAERALVERTGGQIALVAWVPGRSSSAILEQTRALTLTQPVS